MKFYRLVTFILIAFSLSFSLQLNVDADESTKIITAANFPYSQTNAISVPEIPSTYIKSIIETNSGIKITWKNINAAKYQLYRSKKKNKGFKLIATVNNSKWIDSKTTPGTVYYYKVRCYENQRTSAYSKTVNFKTPAKKPRLNFERNLKSFIKKHVYRHYPCNVLVNKYVESCNSLTSGKKAKRSRQFNNVKLQGSPRADNWKHGNAKLSLKYTTAKKYYNENGTVKSKTFPLKSSGTKKVISRYEPDMSRLKKGDIITYSRNGRGSHVAIYIGKFSNKSKLIDYLNNEVGIKCNNKTSWIKSWNGNCKYWVLQGGMGYNNQVYICNNANITTTNDGGSRLSHSISLFENE